MKIIVLKCFDSVIYTFVDIYLNHHGNIEENAWVIFLPFNCSNLLNIFPLFATACWFI